MATKRVFTFVTYLVPLVAVAVCVTIVCRTLWLVYELTDDPTALVFLALIAVMGVLTIIVGVLELGEVISSSSNTDKEEE